MSSTIMSKAKAEESREALTLSLTDNNVIHPQAFDPNLQDKWFYIKCFVTFAVGVLMCITFHLIFKEHASILIMMLTFTVLTVNFKVTFCAWRRLYLSHYLKQHGTLSLAKVMASLSYQNGTRLLHVEFPLCSSNGTAVTNPIVSGVGTRRLIMTEEAYNNAIQSHGGIPMLFKAFANPPPVPAIITGPFDFWLYHGIAVPAEGEVWVSFDALIMSTISMIALFFLIWFEFQQVLYASKEDGMEWLLPTFYFFLGMYFIILQWAFWTAVTGHSGLEYTYRKSKSDAEWRA